MIKTRIGWLSFGSGRGRRSFSVGWFTGDAGALPLPERRRLILQGNFHNDCHVRLALTHNTYLSAKGRGTFGDGAG
jgi:hypothetical protein